MNIQIDMRISLDTSTFLIYVLQVHISFLSGTLNLGLRGTSLTAIQPTPTNQKKRTKLAHLHMSNVNISYDSFPTFYPLIDKFIL